MNNSKNAAKFEVNMLQDAEDEELMAKEAVAKHERKHKQPPTKEERENAKAAAAADARKQQRKRRLKQEINTLKAEKEKAIKWYENNYRINLMNNIPSNIRKKSLLPSENINNNIYYDIRKGGKKTRRKKRKSSGLKKRITNHKNKTKRKRKERQKTKH